MVLGDGLGNSGLEREGPLRLIHYSVDAGVQVFSCVGQDVVCERHHQVLQLVVLGQGMRRPGGRGGRRWGWARCHFAFLCAVEGAEREKCKEILSIQLLCAGSRTEGKGGHLRRNAPQRDVASTYGSFTTARRFPFFLSSALRETTMPFSF